MFKKVSSLLPAQDSAARRGVYTTVQAGIATFFLIPLTNLIIALWGIDEVQRVVLTWAKDYILLIAGSVGISSGIVAFVLNLLFRKDVKTY